MIRSNVLLLTLASMFMLASVQVFSQQVRPPKNAIGMYAGIEWNTLSGLTGIEYQRTVHTVGSIELGIKAAYILLHRNGNLQLLKDSDEGATSTAMLMATTHYFTSPGKDRHRGFFVYGGPGLGQRTTQWEGTAHSAQIPVMDVGIGWRLALGERVALCWTSGITFAGEGGITLTRLSVNF